MTIHNKIRILTKTILNDIPNQFDGNELAYITLQSKNEMQIRDKFAWKMQCELDKEYGFGQYGVRREWSKTGRSKVDVAILRFKNGLLDTVVALMEFKAHHCLNNEPWPKVAFPKDVKKMKNMCKNYPNTDLYFIFLHTGIGKNIVFWGDMATYKGYYKSCRIYPDASYEKELAKYWKDMFYKNPNVVVKKKVKPSLPIVSPIGISFGIDLYLSTMIWGPFKPKTIII